MTSAEADMRAAKTPCLACHETLSNLDAWQHQWWENWVGLLQHDGREDLRPYIFAMLVRDEDLWEYWDPMLLFKATVEGAQRPSSRSAPGRGRS